MDWVSEVMILELDRLTLLPLTRPLAQPYYFLDRSSSAFRSPHINQYHAGISPQYRQLNSLNFSLTQESGLNTFFFLFNILSIFN